MNLKWGTILITHNTLPFFHCLVDTYFTEKQLNAQAKNVISEAQFLYAHTAIFPAQKGAKREGQHPLNKPQHHTVLLVQLLLCSGEHVFKNNLKLVNVLLRTGCDLTQELKLGLEDKFFSWLSEIFCLHQINLKLLAEGGELFPCLL